MLYITTEDKVIIMIENLSNSLSLRSRYKYISFI